MFRFERILVGKKERCQGVAQWGDSSAHEVADVTCCAAQSPTTETVLLD